MDTELENPNVNKFISSIYLDEDVADVHFTFPNDDPSAKIPAVKAILAAASPVFKEMFYGPLRQSNIVEITESTASAFQEFLQIFYLPKIKLTVGNFAEVVRLADRYGLLASFQDCIAFLGSQLTIESMAWGYHLAILLSVPKLKEFCERKIQEFATDVLQSESFLQSERTVVEHMLMMKSLNCTECHLFDACIAWAKLSCRKNGLNETDSKNLKDRLGPCFYLIRFGAFSGRKICKILSNPTYKDLFSQDELIEVMQMSHQKNFQAKILNSELRLRFPSELVCARDNEVTEKLQIGLWVPSQEWTWFSVNEPLSLKQLQFKIRLFDEDALSSEHENVHWDAKLEIIEYDARELEFVFDAPSEIRYTGNCSVGLGYNVNNSVSLSEPIVIDRKKIHAIRLTPIRCADAYYYHTTPWEKKVHLNDRVTVKFHRKKGHTSLYRGFVSSLLFDQID